MRIVALDPGGTTGYCLYDNWDGHTFVCHQLSGEDHHIGLYTQLTHDSPGLVLCERFNYQRRDKVVLKPVEYIGVAKLWCETHNIIYLEQTPAQAMNFWEDDKIKKLDLWQPGEPHAMDALRHMLYYLTFTANDRQWIERLRDPRG